MKNINFSKTAIASALLVVLNAPHAFADPIKPIKNASKPQGANQSSADRTSDQSIASGKRDGTSREDSRAKMKDQDQGKQSDANQILSDARTTYNSLLDKTGIPRDVVAKANCVAVIPNVRSLALVVGRQSGNGVISCKTAGEDMTQWSNPAFIELTSTSFGAQAGRDRKDMVFFIVGEKESRRFIDGTATFGTDLSVVAGPVAGGVDQDFRIGSGVYTYASEERGIFAGLSLSSGNVRLDNENNKSFYGKELKVEEALTLQEPGELSGAGKEFTNALSSTPEKVKKN